MDQSTQIINRVLPIIFLLFMGNQMHRRNFLSENTVEELRKIVINLALPSVLFLSFSQIEIKSTYLFIFIMIFLLALAMFGVGSWIASRFHVHYDYFRFLMTGFEYGMLGVSLFGGAYGLENIGYFAIMDVGHEIFIWFVLLAFLMIQRDGTQNSKQLMRAFFQAPVIMAVLAGLGLNILGAKEYLYPQPILGGIMSTLQFLANLTIPIMLLVIGYSIRIDRLGIREALPVIFIRLAILIPLVFTINNFVIRKYLELDFPFEAALFTLLILPPPFIIPLYMHPDQIEEKRYVNNVLALYTVVSIVIFITYFLFHPNLQ